MINPNIQRPLITTEYYAAKLLMRQAPGMVGFLDEPESYKHIITGLCAPEDETPWRYTIDTRTAQLLELVEVKS